MSETPIPAQHPLPEVELLRPYITDSVTALAGSDVQVHESWLDPCGPRDATILYSPVFDPAEVYALVWDEETGWRNGLYLAGRQGVRTQLDNAAYLGGGVLADPRDLAARAASGIAVPMREYRSHSDLHDGFDDALRRHEGSFGL
jgi:hypothetical protein